MGALAFFANGWTNEEESISGWWSKLSAKAKLIIYVTSIVLLVSLFSAKGANAADVTVSLPAPCTVSTIQQVSVAPDHKAIGAHCDAVVSNPGPVTTGATACTTNTPSDIPGYKALCFGGYLFHPGGSDVSIQPASLTFKFAFGADWPGSRFGDTSIFTTNGKQYVSFPFVTTSAHTISLNENQTYTDGVATFSISTRPGLFTKDAVGVVCSATNNPAIKVTSNGNDSAQCKLEAGKQYWFNAVNAKKGFFRGWYSNCKGPSCRVGITIYSVN